MRQSPPRRFYFCKTQKQTNSELPAPGPHAHMQSSGQQRARLNPQGGCTSTWRDLAGKWNSSGFSWWSDLLFAESWCWQRMLCSPSILGISSGTLSVNGQRGEDHDAPDGHLREVLVPFYEPRLSFPSPWLRQGHFLCLERKLSSFHLASRRTANLIDLAQLWCCWLLLLYTWVC